MLHDTNKLKMPHDNATSDGREIYYWPKHLGPFSRSMRDIDRKNKEAAEARASVLFGSGSVKDPLDRSQRLTHWSPTLKARPEDRPAPFKLSPYHFLQRARTMAPKNPPPTASSFSQWVYSIYGTAFGDREDRERGKDIEQEVLDRRMQAACSIDDDLLLGIKSDWSLYHNGLHLEQNKTVKFFEIDHLRVNGKALRVSPDLVFKNERKSGIIIVEIKHSRLPITTNLWPNVWAQLWCYAQIDVARSAKDVAVVGEVWGERWTRARGQGRKRVEGHPLICLRASVRRDPRAPAYDRFFSALFNIYRGEC